MMAGDNGLYPLMTRGLRSLHARKIVIARSIVAPSLCPSRESICVSLD